MSDRVSVVILDPTSKPAEDLEYCVHGPTLCYAGCGTWLWLGDKTVELLRSGTTVGFCIPCATKVLPQAGATKAGRVDDHRRADGPH
jgi:hypothetical protein